MKIERPLALLGVIDWNGWEIHKSENVKATKLISPIWLFDLEW
jgi:hypothetical protein